MVICLKIQTNFTPEFTNSLCTINRFQKCQISFKQHEVTLLKNNGKMYSPNSNYYQILIDLHLNKLFYLYFENINNKYLLDLFNYKSHIPLNFRPFITYSYFLFLYTYLMYFSKLSPIYNCHI
jgi:hypothetical protein